MCASANADIVTLGGSGWQASWDDSLDPFLEIHFVDQVGDSVIIQQGAEFTQGPDEFGLFPSIPVTFQQVAPSTVNQIVIADEILTNSTGVTWTEFHWDLLGDAVFYSGPGFIVPPNWHFCPDGTCIWVDGIVVPDGTSWFPGDGATNGNLIIEVESTGSTVFTLDQYPVPEPGTLALLALGAIGVLRSRP
jgi:hypothetical protein